MEARGRQKMWAGMGEAGAPPTKKHYYDPKLISINRRSVSYTVPAGRKDACTLLSLQAQKPISYCRNMCGWFGGRGKIIRIDVCQIFIIWQREKSGKPPKSFSEFNNCNSSPILLFCPRNPKSCFSWRIQKDARRKMIEICLFKS